MGLPTFSAVGRVLRCPQSWTLARVNRDVQAAAINGTHRHDSFNAVLTGEDMTDADTFRDPIKWLQPEGPGAPIYAELALAFNPDQGRTRKLGYNIGRDYTAHGADPASDYCGSLDAASVLSLRSRGGGLSGRVLDLKTGQTRGDVWQLKAQSTALAYLENLDEVSACFYYLQTGEFEAYHWTRSDLEGFCAEMKALKAVLTNGAVGLMPLTEGSHCTYCPAFAACPAKISLAKELAGGVKGEALSAKDAGRAYAKLLDCEMLLKRVRENLEGIARLCPLELPDGRTVREVEQSREKLNALIAADILTEYIDNQDELLKVCPPTTSKAAITRALGKATAEEVFRKIAAEGGIEKQTYRILKTS